MKYSLFGKNTGLYVSELILGGAMFGTAKGNGAHKEEANAILKSYADAGGNFIDTSDAYQYGESEAIIGDFMGQNRNNFVLSTKFARSAYANPSLSQLGNNRKAMVQSIEESLRRLKTDRIDIYIAHFDDGITPVEEVERGLDDLIRSGKIVYGGLSNYPAWKVAAAIKASTTTKSTISALQVEYSLIERTPDRELLPMAEHFGLGVMAYSPLYGGLLTGKYRKNEKGRLDHSAARNIVDPRHESILDMLITIGNETGLDPGNIAVAWMIAKGLYPVIGPRVISHLSDYLKATTISLTPGQMDRLEKVSAISLGYPHEIIQTQAAQLKNNFQIRGY